MSVLSVMPDPTPPLRRGTLRAQFNREMSRFFRVYTDSPSDGPEVVLAQTGLTLPARGDSYVDANGNADPYCVCQTVNCSEADDPQKWTVEVVYSSQATNVTREDVDPTLEEPVISWGEEVIQKYTAVDLNGIPIQSSSGEPYVGGIAVEGRIRTLTITRNEYFFNAAQADQFEESVNLDPIWDYDAGMVWLYAIVCPNAHEFRSGIEYAAVSYKFKLARVILDPATQVVINAWDAPAQLDQGLMVLNSAGKRVPILEGATPVTTPRALDGSGNLLARSVADGSATAGSYLLDSGTANFTPADIGAQISIEGAGPGGAQLQTTVASVSGISEVVLADLPATTVAGAVVLISKPPAYIYPQIYPQLDWSELGLPPTL